MSEAMQIQGAATGLSVGLGAVSPVGGPDPARTLTPTKDFKSILLNSLDEVNRLQGEADQRVQSLVSGDTDNVAEVFAAVNKAGIAFSLLMEVRNKLIDAYRDIQQMRV